jgi:hypothetical protein
MASVGHAQVQLEADTLQSVSMSLFVQVAHASR